MMSSVLIRYSANFSARHSHILVTIALIVVTLVVFVVRVLVVVVDATVVACS